MDLEDNLSSGSVVVRGANHENFKVTTLPTLPRYVQKYSSFVTTDPPNSIHTSLCRIFDSKQIDYDTDLNSFIFHAVYTDSSDLRECTFKVNFFSTNADQGETFVEFQRRTGCSLAFNQLYQSITKVLGDNVLNAVNGTPIQQSQNILPEFKVTPLEFDNKIITSLYTSAISPNIDESTEAFRTLASNTTNHSNNVALILSQLHDTKHVPALTEVICSSLALHDDVASRHASAFLANLVSHQNSGPLHSWLISDCLEPLLALNTASSKDLVTSSSGSETFEQDDKEPKFSILLNRETRRQMTKIIHQLSRTYPDITTQASQTSTNTSNDSPQIILS